MGGSFYTLFFCLTLLASGDQLQDPFAPEISEAVDRAVDKTSEEFLSDRTLKALNEKRLDKGTTDDRRVIRLTVLQVLDDQLVFTWQPATEKREATLSVKRLKCTYDNKWNITKQILKEYEQINLQPAQDRLLKSLYANAPIQALPQAPWTTDDVIGSLWIYEVATKDKSVLVVRRNPVNPILQGSTVSPARIKSELQLTTFGVVLWTLSGVDVTPN